MSMGEEDRATLGAGTCVLAAAWVVFLIGAGTGVMPRFREMFQEMQVDLPLSTRIVFGALSPLGIALGGLAAVGLVAKALLLPERTSKLIDGAAWVALVLAIGFVVIALFLPLIGPPMIPRPLTPRTRDSRRTAETATALPPGHQAHQGSASWNAAPAPVRGYDLPLTHPPRGRILPRS